MLKLERAPFVGDEHYLNFVLMHPRRPHLKIKVKHDGSFHTGSQVEIEGYQYEIMSVWPHGPVQKGYCFIRVKRIGVKPRRFHARDLPDRDALEYLAARKPYHGATWHQFVNDPSDSIALSCYPEFATFERNKLVLTKLRRLVARKYVEGCDCGCYGSFKITDAGRQYLQQLKDNNA